MSTAVLSSPPRATARVVAGVAALGVAGVGLWCTVRLVAGVPLSQVTAAVSGLPASALLLLTGVWCLGLAIYATVLVAAMPGLGYRQALVLNLTGSAVANVVPLGGAVATGMNWRMTRCWGHTTRSFGAFCVLTNALDVAAKLALPILAVALLSAEARHVPAWLWCLAATAAVGLALGWHAMRRRPAPDQTSPPTSGCSRGRLGRAWQHGTEVLARSRDRLEARRGRLLLGSVAYVAAQVLLLMLCLHALGVHAAWVDVVTAAAIERLGTVLAVSPGGLGLAEVGPVAWLVSTGLDPLGVAAAVLLYRAFVVGLEIPVGASLLTAWWWRNRSGSFAPARDPGVAA